MPTPVPLKILSRRGQRIRLIIVLLFALGVGMLSGWVRPMITGSIHYEALAAVVVLSAACIVLLLGLRQITYRRAAPTFVIEGTALWLCYAIGWSIIGRRIWGDLFAVAGTFWACTVLLGLVTLWIVQRIWPPRRSLSCLDCGYDLHGLTTGICPECGASFDATCHQCGCSLRRLDTDTCNDCQSPLNPSTVLISLLRRP